MSSKRVLANERRLALIEARRAEKVIDAAAADFTVALERVIAGEFDPPPRVPLDKVGAPIWSGRKANIYCKPANKRMLLVRWGDGTTGKVMCKPEKRSRFRPGDDIWAVEQGKDWVLVGHYNGSGRRVG
jgi:hypothetical protein